MLVSYPARGAKLLFAAQHSGMDVDVCADHYTLVRFASQTTTLQIGLSNPQTIHTTVVTTT